MQTRILFQFVRVIGCKLLPVLLEIITMYYVRCTPDGHTGISVLRVSSEKLQRKIYIRKEEK